MIGTQLEAIEQDVYFIRPHILQQLLPSLTQYFRYADVLGSVNVHNGSNMNNANGRQSPHIGVGTPTQLNAMMNMGSPMMMSNMNPNYVRNMNSPHMSPGMANGIPGAGFSANSPLGTAVRTPMSMPNRPQISQDQFSAQMQGIQSRLINIQHQMHMIQQMQAGPMSPETARNLQLRQGELIRQQQILQKQQYSLNAMNPQIAGRLSSRPVRGNESSMGMGQVDMHSPNFSMPQMGWMNANMNVGNRMNLHPAQIQYLQQMQALQRQQQAQSMQQVQMQGGQLQDFSSLQNFMGSSNGIPTPNEKSVPSENGADAIENRASPSHRIATPQLRNSTAVSLPSPAGHHVGSFVNNASPGLNVTSPKNETDQISQQIQSAVQNNLSKNIQGNAIKMEGNLVDLGNDNFQGSRPANIRINTQANMQGNMVGNMIGNIPLNLQTNGNMQVQQPSQLNMLHNETLAQFANPSMNGLKGNFIQNAKAQQQHSEKEPLKIDNKESSGIPTQPLSASENWEAEFNIDPSKPEISESKEDCIKVF
jgi:hypothetical protein